jgi:RNA polymerase-binding transcription factor DksA
MISAALRGILDLFEDPLIIRIPHESSAPAPLHDRSQHMKPDEIEEFRTMLKLLRARLRGDVEQIREEALSGHESGNDQRSSNHMAEMGSDAWDLEFSLQLVESDQNVLDEIAHAMKKLDDGTFGLCEHCLEMGRGEAKARIARVRLQAIPYARNCIECEREKEKRR